MVKKKAESTLDDNLMHVAHSVFFAFLCTFITVMNFFPQKNNTKYESIILVPYKAVSTPKRKEVARVEGCKELKFLRSSGIKGFSFSSISISSVTSSSRTNSPFWLKWTAFIRGQRCHWRTTFEPTRSLTLLAISFREPGMALTLKRSRLIFLNLK